MRKSNLNCEFDVLKRKLKRKEQMSKAYFSRLIVSFISCTDERRIKLRCVPNFEFVDSFIYFNVKCEYVVVLN